VKSFEEMTSTKFEPISGENKKKACKTEF